jgi:hypothetical protein
MPKRTIHLPGQAIPLTLQVSRTSRGEFLYTFTLKELQHFMDLASDAAYENYRSYPLKMRDELLKLRDPGGA